MVKRNDQIHRPHEPYLGCCRVKTFAEWKPPDGREGLGKILKEGLDRSSNAVKDAIEMTLAFHPVARLVMRELLAANKIVIMALFATEIPAYYDKLLSKTGGGEPIAAVQGRMLGSGHQALANNLQGSA